MFASLGLQVVVAMTVRPGSNPDFRPERIMLKWLLVVVLIVLVAGLMQPRLAQRLRLGRLPGDLAFRFRGRAYHFPFVTTLLLSVLAWLILRAI